MRRPRPLAGTAERNEQAALAFEAELGRAVLAIGEAPSRLVRHIGGTGWFVLHRFPFSIVPARKSRRAPNPGLQRKVAAVEPEVVSCSIGSGSPSAEHAGDDVDPRLREIA